MIESQFRAGRAPLWMGYLLSPFLTFLIHGCDSDLISSEGKQLGFAVPLDLLTPQTFQSSVNINEVKVEYSSVKGSKRVLWIKV